MELIEGRASIELVRGVGDMWRFVFVDFSATVQCFAAAVAPLDYCAVQGVGRGPVS
jgi:hypothetical protein